MAEAKPEKSRVLMPFRQNRKLKIIYKHYFFQFCRYIATFRGNVLFHMHAEKVEDNVPASRG